MEVKLRQRIIGAVVLVALAIIFLPLLFKSSSNGPSTEAKQVTLSAQIPPAPAKPAPQTIVMIQNKDLSTPDKNLNLTNTAITSRAPTIQQPVTLQSGATSQALAASQKPPSISQPLTTGNVQSTTSTKNPTNQSSNPPTAGTISQNINLVEDKTLSPPGVSNNVTNASQTTTKTAHVSNNLKTTKKYEKVKEGKHTTTASKQPATTKAPHGAATKSVSTTNTKIHSDVTHHAKAANTTASAEAVSHKKPSTTKTFTIATPASSTNLTAAKNTKTPVGTAWEVHLGSFANANNVKELVSQLRSHGFKAYTQSIQTSLGTLTRVAIGPEVKRDKADAIQERLTKELKIKSEIIPFDPVAENK